MATTSLATARWEFAEYLGYSEIVGKDGAAWTTTSNIGAGTTIISTELRDYGFDDPGDAGSGDDIFDGHWVIIKGSNNDGTVRRIKSYDASAGQITVFGTNLSAESGSVDFEIHKQSPTYLRQLLNTAGRTAFPIIHVPVHRTLFTASSQRRYEVPSAIVSKPTAIWLEKSVPYNYTDTILSNGGFEDWTSSTVDSWSATTLDIAEESSTTSPRNYAVFRDDNSVRCTSRSGSTGTLLQSISSPGSHSGQFISLQVWVYCTTTSIVSTAIKLGSITHLGTAGTGGLHTGSGWELLTQTEDSAITLSSLDVGISVVSTATDNTEFYVDEAVCVVGPTQEPQAGFFLLPNWTYMPTVEGATLRNHVVFPYSLPEQMLLRFEGKNYLTALSAETDTLEIARPQTDLLYAYAAMELYKDSYHVSPDSEQRYERTRLNAALQDIEQLGHLGVRRPKHDLMIPNA